MIQTTEDFIQQELTDSKEVATQAEQTVWVNTYLLTNFLFLDIKSIADSLGEERAKAFVRSAADLPSPAFLRSLLEIKVRYWEAILKKTEDKRLQAEIENKLTEIQLYTKILVTTVNAHAEYLIQKNGNSQFEAIAKMVAKFIPKYPDRWPPQTDEEKQKIANLDKQMAQRPKGFVSDVLLDVDASVCRHAYTLSSEVCESRGLNPYAVSIKMRRGEISSGHLLSVIFEDNDKSKPIFVDGQNGFSISGFDNYKKKWQQSGWTITSAEASRLISDENGSHWDVINFS